MKFIVDAHLPLQLSEWITEMGYDCIHTRNLPDKNLTKDHAIINLSMHEQRIVISKDTDFYDYYVLKKQPYKLLLLTTGNISNKELIALFIANFDQLKIELEHKKVIEFNRQSILVHY